MKKMSKKIISIFVTINIILCTFLTSSVSYANEIDPGSYRPTEQYGIDRKFATEYGGKAFGALTYISIIVAVITLMFVGIKYIAGSASQKAEYKKDLLPIGIGIILVSMITTIISVIASAGAQIGH
ncbi:MAG: hypothetical protein IKE01_04040 [Clostridia bacterium]|nr:hypothetical protein [Clostridia bacterium]